MPQDVTIAPSALIARNPGLISTKIDAEAVLLDVDSGYFFQLNQTASRIRSALDTPLTFDALCDRMVESISRAGS